MYHSSCYFTSLLNQEETYSYHFALLAEYVCMPGYLKFAALIYVKYKCNYLVFFIFVLDATGGPLLDSYLMVYSSLFCGASR